MGTVLFLIFAVSALLKDINSLNEKDMKCNMRNLSKLEHKVWRASIHSVMIINKEIAYAYKCGDCDSNNILQVLNRLIH